MFRDGKEIEPTVETSKRGLIPPTLARLLREERGDSTLASILVPFGVGAIVYGGISVLIGTGNVSIPAQIDDLSRAAMVVGGGALAATGGFMTVVGLFYDPK